MTSDERKRYDDDVKFRNAVCEHGSQRRKCNTCDLLCEQHDNAALRARIEVLEKVAEAARDWMQVERPTEDEEEEILLEKFEILRAALDAVKEGKG